MNYADIKFPDIQDGEGIRVAIYVSGCHFHCKECHNKEAWEFNYGKKFTDDTINEIMKLLRKPYVQGLSLLGGEPLELVNQEGLLPLVKKVKEELPEKDIWCWTGFRFDTDILENMYEKNIVTKELMNYIDIIIDGQFEIENKIVDLAFRGSTNQRKVDVSKSLQEGKTIYLKFGDESRYENEKIAKQPKVMWFAEFKKSDDGLTEKENNGKIINRETIQVDWIEENKTEPQKIEIKEEKEIVAAKGID